MGRPRVLRPQLRRDSLGGGWRTSPKGNRGVVAAELERPARMTMARGGYPEATPPQPHRRRPGFRGLLRDAGGPPPNWRLELAAPRSKEALCCAPGTLR